MDDPLETAQTSNEEKRATDIQMPHNEWRLLVPILAGLLILTVIALLLIR